MGQNGLNSLNPPLIENRYYDNQIS